MENKQYFEIPFANDFERAFVVNGLKYQMKYISGRSHGYGSTSLKGMLVIQSKSDISVFVKIKLYRINKQDCMLTKSSVLQNGQVTFEVNLNFDSYYNHNPGPFICSIKVTRYEKYQSILDLAQKMNQNGNRANNKSPTTERKLDDLSCNMKMLLEQGDLSDVILSNGSKDFRAHKLILSARSKVFSKMFQHPMKENHENRVTITDVPSEVLKELLTFIYTGVVTIKDMKMARDLYVAADKYDLKELWSVCSKYLKDVDMDSVFDIIALADLHRDKILKQSTLDFISANYSNVKAHKKWASFMKENQTLALEVLSFVLDKRTE